MTMVVKGGKKHKERMVMLKIQRSKIKGCERRAED